MAMLLYIIGAIAVMVGAATVAFGIPINEFSFGNTLIVSGSIVGTGGLVIIGIAAAVARLNRIADALGERAAMLPHEEAQEAQEPQAAPTRFPFPPRTRPVELPPGEPPPLEPAEFPPPPEVEERPSFAPSLRNPEAPAAEEVPPPAEAAAPGELPPEPAVEKPWRAAPPPPPPPSAPPPKPPPVANFDAMWPERQAKPAPGPEEAPPSPEAPPPAAEPSHAVAILKSGVVDGMGYTLYVDGSIEADLPQGTMRFASIDELRAHLEKGT
jgi:hypothetical protein